MLIAAVMKSGDESSQFHRELATRDCMESLKRLAHDSQADKVKEKVLELLQCWAYVFRERIEYKVPVAPTVTTL